MRAQDLERLIESFFVDLRMRIAARGALRPRLA